MEPWKGMTEFMAVCETGSFSKAAGQLDVTVSQVSKRVAELENRLSVRLLDRSTRSVTPTTQGRLFYQSCRKLLADFDQAREELLDKDQLTGLLRLCSVGGSRPAFQMDLYRAFLDRYPGLSLEVLYHDDVPNLVSEGIDLALVLGEASEPAGSARFHLCWIEYALVASPDLLSRYPAPQSPEDLARLPCIVQGNRIWRLARGEQVISVTVAGRFASNNMPACIDACLSGHGVFMVPVYSLDSLLASGRAVAVLPDWRLRQGMYAMIPSPDYVPTKVILMMEFLEQVMGSGEGDAGKLGALLQRTSAQPMEVLRGINQGAKQADLQARQRRRPEPPPA